MRHRPPLAGVMLGVLLLAPGCGAADDQAKEPPMNEPSSPSSPQAKPSDQVRAAVADLADRLQVDRAAIEVVGEEPVTWRDGSLGCAQPGRSYTQALVEGSRITLRVDGVEHEYHSGPDQQPFWCRRPTQ